MHRILSDGLWDEIKNLAKKSTVKRAAVAYVSDDATIKFGRNDTLIVNASQSAIAQGQTSATVLERAFKRGARLFSIEGLHAKVMLFDNIAIVSSANISRSSETSLVEAGLVTDQIGIVDDAYNLIGAIEKQSIEIDDLFIQRIKKIKVERRGGASRRASVKSTVRVPARQTWLISLSPYGKREEEESIRLELMYGTAVRKHFLDSSSTLDTYHFSGNSRFRREAKAGDSIIYIWHEITWAERRWGGRRDLPEGVYRHVHIRRRLNRPDGTWFFVETSPTSGDDRVNWRKFLGLVKRADITGRIGPYSTRLLDEADAQKLDALWGK